VLYAIERIIQKWAILSVQTGIAKKLLNYQSACSVMSGWIPTRSAGAVKNVMKKRKRRKHSMPEILETNDTLFLFRGVPVTRATCLRIREGREGYYYYNIRHDESGRFNRMEKYVLANHFATIETSAPIPELEYNNEQNHELIMLTREEINTIGHAL
jgi:hypothetical protein